ncbi:MAG TPA: 6-carboxytetrahydropterin synthase [Candidatus Odoribacter faecigallinarum]|uniref:6-carboxy-5,6,7,8-tetrahydropterin synthase n=1 Tax=Candidatus Odoribacter faecigallinarum TaxID=2838706 RepID=A0A9D1V0A6_9BACT|nr:6-carboxytetrahydropterin synthase [Candidatus Odoribacter faecigallinarum]
MIIRKLFKFEGAHIVRHCSSEKCRENIHGHSYVVEVFLTSDKLDNGYMVMDFCRLDKVKQFIESFDHTYSLWNREPEDFKAFIYQYNRRVAELPVSPSAEGYALLFFYAIDHILKGMPPVNGEGHVQLHSVRVHETATGYAEAFREDLEWVDFTMKDIKFSFCQFD